MRNHLATFLDDFRTFPDEIAIVRYQGNRRRVSTYGDIARLAGRFAAFLAQHQIGKGDRVLLWAENSSEWMSAFYGCMLRGVLVVPLDAYGSPEFAARAAADVKPRLAVGDAQLLRHLAAAQPGYLRISFQEWDAALPANEAGPVSGMGPDTPLQILFTSGTTGEPKGIVHTHGNVIASVGPIEQAAQKYMRYERLIHPLRILHTLPLSHVFGQTMGLWVPPIFRAEVHFETRLVAPLIIETIGRERISVLAAVPRVFALLKAHLESKHPGLAEQLADSQKRPAGRLGWKRWWRFRAIHKAFGFKFWALISGGGALTKDLEQFWNALGFVLVQGYGMTETTALITLNHPFHVARGTIGKPLPGRDVKLGPDGEVLVRGPMISSATWSGGGLRQRESEWLSTGDLAETAPTGELRFLGRKSEVIVTSTGVNIHPEDLEAVIEQQPGVAACAVVALETAAGPEPCAVLAMRGGGKVAEAIEHANAQLPDFQRVRRWMLWPEPDLPRTSTGKVRHKTVADWLVQSNAADAVKPSQTGATPASRDWLLALIAVVTGESPQAAGDDARLSEDLHLDSLGRVQLDAAIEQRLGMTPESGLLERAQTLGDVRRLLASEFIESPVKVSEEPAAAASKMEHGDRSDTTPAVPNPQIPVVTSVAGLNSRTSAGLPNRKYVYPHWPWLWPVQLIRAAFIEMVMRPLIWLLVNPRITAPVDFAGQASRGAPMLVIANHITAYDGPLVQYALPGLMRRQMAAAMSGEMLEDFRHSRNPDHGPKHGHFFLFGFPAYLLVTALFNVFPLPRFRDFQRSFAHAGEALDRGFNVLVFPEGTRSAAGQLAPFRPGIGLLAKQSGTAVLPVAIRGLGELKERGRGWFRSGTIEVRVGEPMRFAPETSEASITARLHAEVERLLNDEA
jgi:long-chain acyl-CoA synthetase